MAWFRSGYRRTYSASGLAALREGDFAEVPVLRHPADEFFNERVRSEKDLLLQLFPRAGLSDALGDEALIASDGSLFARAKGRQQPIPAQPIRTLCLIRRRTRACQPEVDLQVLLDDLVKDVVLGTAAAVRSGLASLRGDGHVGVRMEATRKQHICTE